MLEFSKYIVQEIAGYFSSIVSYVPGDCIFLSVIPIFSDLKYRYFMRVFRINPRQLFKDIDLFISNSQA